VPVRTYPTPDPYQRPAPEPGAVAWGDRSTVAVIDAKSRGDLPLALLVTPRLP